jgi:hypothetical protein
MYFAECMTGFEYQVAAHCISEGLLDEGLSIARAVHDRYSPAKRNPFNEIECSDHYARAMASYACCIAACGFRHSGPDGLVGFAPRLGVADFRAAFTAAEGWGRYRRIEEGGRVRESVELRHGSLRLRTFECEVPAGSASFLAEARHNGSPTPASFSLDGVTLRCSLPADVVLSPGGFFEVVYATSPQPADADADGDGLSDLEEATGTDDAAATPIDPRGRTTDPTRADSDGDETGDGVEARLGTDPLDPGSFFRAAMERAANGDAVVRWPSSPGATFTVQRSADLADWQTIAAGVEGLPGETEYADRSAPQGQPVYYRVAIEPPA